MTFSMLCHVEAGLARVRVLVVGLTFLECVIFILNLWVCFKCLICLFPIAFDCVVLY